MTQPPHDSAADAGRDNRGTVSPGAGGDPRPPDPPSPGSSGSSAPGESEEERRRALEAKRKARERKRKQRERERTGEQTTGRAEAIKEPMAMAIAAIVDGPVRYKYLERTDPEFGLQRSRAVADKLAPVVEPFLADVDWEKYGPAFIAAAAVGGAAVDYLAEIRAHRSAHPPADVRTVHPKNVRDVPPSSADDAKKGAGNG